MEKIRMGILGYGNLGRGVELAIEACPDIKLVGIYTRRAPASINPALSTTKVYSFERALENKDEIDVMILCGGSATDLEVQSPQMAAIYNIVDSFDAHPRIGEHFKKVDKIAMENNHTAIISVGWDPGLFSLNRLLGEAILPQGESHTFWGKGVSQGHSDALRRIQGVAGAVQYTIPKQEALNIARTGSAGNAEPGKLTPRDKHLRECYVVLEEGADPEKVKQAIVTMPDYFADYDTIVNFISKEELQVQHKGMPHGGFSLRRGKTGKYSENSHLYEFSLQLESNPEFTASVLVAYGRAAYRLTEKGDFGGKTILDVAPGLLSPKSGELLRAELL